MGSFIGWRFCFLVRSDGSYPGRSLFDTTTPTHTRTQTVNDTARILRSEFRMKEKNKATETNRVARWKDHKTLSKPSTKQEEAVKVLKTAVLVRALFYLLINHVCLFFFKFIFMHVIAFGTKLTSKFWFHREKKKLTQNKRLHKGYTRGVHKVDIFVTKE